MKSKAKKNNIRYCGSKLSHAIINKIQECQKSIDSKMTSNEFSILMYLALVQDTLGRVYGVHYADISNLLHMSEQTFYNAINGLIEKDFIISLSERFGYWDFMILNNKFHTPENDSKGYINVNRDAFFTKRFLKLKVNEKLLCLIMLKNIGGNKDGRNRVYARTIATEWLGLKTKSLAIVYRYLKNISYIFDNYKLTGEKPYMTSGHLIVYIANWYYLDVTYKEYSEFEHHFTHKIKHFLKANKCLIYSDKIREIVKLINQYKNKGIYKITKTIQSLLATRTYSSTLVSHYMKMNTKEWEVAFRDL